MLVVHSVLVDLFTLFEIQRSADDDSATSSSVRRKVGQPYIELVSMRKDKRRRDDKGKKPTPQRLADGTCWCPELHVTDSLLDVVSGNNLPIDDNGKKPVTPRTPTRKR